MTQPSATGPLDPRPRQIPHTLNLFSRLKEGAVFVERLNDRFTFYQRSFRWFGGCWQAVLELDPEPTDTVHVFDPDYAYDWALNRIGFHFQERIGGQPIWTGMVDEVELTVDGWGERYSLLPVVNKVRAAYVDSNGEAQKTGWVQNAVSQSRFGVREKELTMEREQASETEALAYANAKLQELAFPQPEPVAASAQQRNHLVVRASGYVFTANARYVSVGAGDYDVSDFIAAITNTDLEFITLGYIQANSALTAIGSSEVTPVWEGFKGVIMLRSDPATIPFTIQVNERRKLNYFQPKVSPTYRWRNRQIYTAAGAGVAVNPWEVYPAVIRNSMTRGTSPHHGSFLEDGRDRIMFEVTMSTRQEQPIITWAGSTEAELKKALEIRRGQEIHSL